jgi:hypothetical protein
MEMLKEEKEFEEYLRAETSLGRNDALAQFRGVMKRKQALVKAVREDCSHIADEHNCFTTGHTHTGSRTCSEVIAVAIRSRK